MKSRRTKRTNPKKKIIVITIILLLLWIGAFYIYTTYKNIQIEPINMKQQNYLPHKMNKLWKMKKKIAKQ